MFKSLIFLAFFFLSLSGISQKVTGTFPHLSNQQIILKGFVGFNTYTIDQQKASSEGTFTLQYEASDYGMGFLTLAGKDNNPFIVILSGEDIHLEGEAFIAPATVQILEGKENQHFAQYAAEHPRREQALSAWIYLKKIYQSDSLFAVQDKPKQAIADEIRRIKAADSAFIASLPNDSYVRWYLPVRKLVTSVSTIAQYRTEEIPATIAALREMDYTDPRLYKSGLLKDVLESHFWLIENSGRPLDSVYAEMKISIDHLIANLSTDEEKLNEITDYLFDLLERHSLFEASEYLALKVLNQESCTIDDDLAKQLETYRAMKLGNTAPDFDFVGDIPAPQDGSENFPEKLSDIESKYKVVIFGASWCPKCEGEIPQIAQHYEKWKSQGVEVVFVSLDSDTASFHDFAGDFPFISICDYQQWESPIAKAYYVFSTPLMYLLDDKRKILLRPKSVEQMDAWVEWFLIEGNPIKMPVR